MSLTMIRIPASRALSLASSRSAPVSRSLSTQCSESVQKLRQVLEEYRLENYTQEIPSRFKKEVAQAAKGANQNSIAPAGLERVLSNIGASNRISESDLDAIFSELGESGALPVQSFVRMI